ncbi:MAG: multidrug ABC transporter ATP-binding protein [Nocardioides sp.]|nr:multidrug ABC transporter ATP-binding protein [Nocardioides sp.]
MSTTTLPHTPSPLGSDTGAAVRLNELRRTYGTGADAYEAVRGLDLEVERGSVLALLGVNGAGKTSTLEVVEGLAPATSGSVEVLGLDPVEDRAAVRRRTGVLLQHSGFAADLTVTETVELWAGLVTDARPVEEALAEVDLGGRADVAVRDLSGGEQRRLDLACSLLGRPELVMLDEPTTGLDPESRRRVWALLQRLRDAGTTILLTTHYLEEAEVLADRIAIMAAGRVVREGTPDELAASLPATISFTTPRGPDGPVVVPPLGAGRRTDRDRTVVETDDLQVTLTSLLTWAAHEGIRLEALDARQATLESVFLDVARVAADAGETHPSTYPASQPEDLR